MRKTTHRVLVACVVALFGPAQAASLLSSTLVRSSVVVAVAASVGVVIYHKTNDGDCPPLYTPTEGSLAGKTVVITGATTGLGLESAKRLALGNPTQLILTARSPSKGQAAVQAVHDYVTQKRSTTLSSTTSVQYKIIDFDNLNSVKNSFSAGEWDDVSQVDVLLNNAGVMALPSLELTVDGFERQIQSNHLGHFLLTTLLAPKFSNNCRIINISSGGHEIARFSGGMAFDYAWKGEPSYSAWKSYGQSKLANVLFTQELQRRAVSSGREWLVTTLHPGAVSTDLSRNMIGGENTFEQMKAQKAGFLHNAFYKGLLFFTKTVAQGATTQVWLAAAPFDNEKILRGQYFDRCKAQKLMAFAQDEDAARRLWIESEQKTGVTFDLPAVQ